LAFLKVERLKSRQLIGEATEAKDKLDDWERRKIANAVTQSEPTPAV
jgi:hypothetical protein